MAAELGQGRGTLELTQFRSTSSVLLLDACGYLSLQARCLLPLLLLLFSGASSGLLGTLQILADRLLFFLSQALSNQFFLGGIGLGMDESVDAGMLAEAAIVVHELTAGFLIQTGLWEGHDQQTLNDLEDVLQRPLCRIPVPLERVHADFTRVLRHVRVENLC